MTTGKATKVTMEEEEEEEVVVETNELQIPPVQSLSVLPSTTVVAPNRSPAKHNGRYQLNVDWFITICKAPPRRHCSGSCNVTQKSRRCHAVNHQPGCTVLPGGYP